MRALHPLLVIPGLLFSGCDKPSTPPQHIQALVKSWAEMGMYLPDKEQVAFFHANLKDASAELEAAVADQNPDVRQRAAFVIGEIGPDANALGDPLFEQLQIEQEQIVQIYLVDALAAVQYKDPKAIAFLKDMYDSLNEENVPEWLFSSGYAEVDEKINLAAALYSLSEGEERQPYLDFVVQWLKLPSDEMNLPLKSGYWERRWMAVISLESMHGATEAIPLLEAMSKEKDAKSWVAVHVPRVLGALKGQ